MDGAVRRLVMVEAAMTLHSDETEAGQELAEVRDRWEELPRWQQAGIIALAAAEIVLTTKAVADLVKRPRPQVRGPKTLWFLTFAVQPFGPIAYLTLGRRKNK